MTYFIWESFTDLSEVIVFQYCGGLLKHLSGILVKLWIWLELADREEVPECSPDIFQLGYCACPAGCLPSTSCIFDIKSGGEVNGHRDFKSHIQHSFLLEINTAHENCIAQEPRNSPKQNKNKTLGT